MGGKYIGKRKKGIPAAVLICLFSAVSVLAAGGLLAKYRTEMKYQAEMIAANFHISSDYLEEGEVIPEYKVSDWADKGIAFDLYNYEKDNVALVAGEQIKYDVSLNAAGLPSGKKAEDYFEIEDATRFLGTSENTTGETKEIKVKIKDQVVVPQSVTSLTVTVTTTEPFVKTLRATFSLIGTHKPVLTVSGPVRDNGDHYIATITTGQYAGDITVNWPSALLPDNTSELMKDWINGTGTSSGIIKNATRFTTYELIFFNPTGADPSGITISPVS